MIVNILLWGLLGYLVCRLLLLVCRVKTRVIVRVRPSNTIEGLLLPEALGHVKDMPEANFIALVKARFAQISTAFAAGELKYIQNLLTPEVSQAFQTDIERRKALGQSVDFKLIDFKSVHLKNQADKNKRWIDFETEQINLLKDNKGKVIEGNEMYLSQVKEKWQFKWDENKGWLLSAIEMVDSHAI